MTETRWAAEPNRPVSRSIGVPPEQLCFRRVSPYTAGRHPRVHSPPRVTATGLDEHGAMRDERDVVRKDKRNVHDERQRRRRTGCPKGH